MRRFYAILVISLSLMYWLPMVSVGQDDADVTSPDVSISIPAGVQTGAFDVTITFTEAVSGFEQADLTLFGDATVSITAWSSTDDTVFTATITPTAGGVVQVSVAAGVATDAADNNNTASGTQTIGVDLSETWMPDENLRQAVRRHTGDPINKVSMIDMWRLNANNSQIADLTGLEYATNLEIASLSANSISDVTPLAGLTNLTELWLSGNSISDVGPLSGLTNLGSLHLRENPISDTSPLYNLLIANGGNIRDIDIDVSEYAPWDVNEDGVVDASDSALVTAALGQSGRDILDTRTDVNGDGVVNADDLALVTENLSVADTVAPEVSISVPEGVQNGEFNVEIMFTEPVLDFEQADLTVSGTANASVTAWVHVNDTAFTATITPTTDGDVEVSVAADVATDAADNNNTASETQTVTVDMTPPDVSISVPEGSQNTLFDVTITFTESVSDFDQADLMVSGTANASVTVWLPVNDTTFTATITPTTDGDVEVSVAADVATDAAGNNNTASDTQTITVDMTPPDVSISAPRGAQNSAFDVTITFTEAVSDFEQSDLTLSGTATASITAWTTTDNTVFTATITPTTGGGVNSSVAAGVATDAAGNNNTAAEVLTVDVDMIPPDVSLSVPEGSHNTPFDVTITFTELVFGFEEADLSVSETAAETTTDDASTGDEASVDETAVANITAWATTDNTVFTATFTPTASGTLTLSVAAGVATDTAGNANTASETQTATIAVQAETETVEALEVWMPDEDLRNVIRGEVGAPITKAKVKEMTSLFFIENTEIENLKGLEHATGLTVLYLGSSSISSLTPLEDLTQLSHLYLGSSSVSDVSALSKLTNLISLSLAESSISDLNGLSTLTSLERLHLNNNEVSDLSGLAGLTSLERLYLGKNEISDLSKFPTLSNLKTLRLSSNKISDLTGLPTLTSLETLYLEKNKISDLSKLPTLTSLKVLYLEENKISDLSGLAGLTSLTSLYLKKNSVSDLTALEDLTSLTRLYLEENSVSDVTPLEDLTSLIRLSLKENSVSDVSPLSGLTNLTGLFLIGNPISDTSPLYALLSANDGSIRSIDIDVYAFWDVNEDGSVDASDVALVTAAIGQSGDDIVNSRTDVNRDGTVDNADLTLVTDNLDDDAAAPLAMGGIASLLDQATLDKLDPTALAAQLDILRAKSDGSLKYLRAIALLESMLAALRPVETLLLANYPNPFNPETWLPYHLANAGAVVITIYDMRGSVVRRLELGHQREGYYTSRARAAYWDGRNHTGERVASGVYFYQLEADDMSLLRKMLILK